MKFLVLIFCFNAFGMLEGKESFFDKMKALEEYLEIPEVSELGKRKLEEEETETLELKEEQKETVAATTKVFLKRLGYCEECNIGFSNLRKHMVDIHNHPTARFC